MLGHEGDEGIGASVLQGETKSWVCLVSSREGLRWVEDLIDVYKYLIAK